MITAWNNNPWRKCVVQNTIPRRVFLKHSIGGTALVLGAARGDSGSSTRAGETAGALTADPRGLTTYQLGPQIWIRWDNRLVTCYRAHRSQKYPYLYPLTGPVSGLSVTSETTLPYPHHRSLFFACDRVNGGNYWQEDYDKGQILSDGPKLGVTTKDSVEILDTCQWQKPGEPVVMRDQRRIVVTVAGPRLRFVDWHIRWEAVENVTVLKTNHSLFAARAALDLAPAGGGQLTNAEGDSGEKATFGKRSAWCDFSGKRDGWPGNVVEGIALMDHPKNPWAPTPWFTRDYGFVSPSPTNFMEKPWELAAGQSVTLRYRVAIHAGDAKDAGIDQIYRDWAAKS
jgi:hypothetical protein